MIKQFSDLPPCAAFRPNLIRSAHAILGDNGAGKTTLLRAIAGLRPADTGAISILARILDACREIGYMAHPSLLYDEMTGMENLRYFAGLYGIESDGRCEEVIRAVGLDPQLTRGVGQYSQGMRQRMSLARAILHDPKLLLLDEPFSNVDVHSAREMVGLLRGMRDDGKTIFVVTHQALLPRALPMSSCGWRRGRLRNARARPSADGRNDVVLGGDVGDAGEGHSAGMALEGRAELHALLFAAGGGDLQFFLRS